MGVDDTGGVSANMCGRRRHRAGSGGFSVERAKTFVAQNFELVIVCVLVAATAFVILVAANKLAFLNFFYIPVLIAAYFLGKKQGVFVALAAVLMVTVFAVLNPGLFEPSRLDSPTLNLILWGGFTVVTAYVVGVLYDVKASTAEDLKRAYEGVLEILAKFIDAVDQYTGNHSVRVSEMAVRIGVVMGLPDDQLENLRVGGLLHDIGKIDVSLDVLRKASALDDTEWAAIKTHPRQGGLMLAPVGGLLSDVVPLVESHHENWDGTGYHGMKGEEIPLGARILAVADAHDAMITDRPYRAGRSVSEAFSEVERCAGKQFDPAVVEAFRHVMQTSPERA